MASNILKTKVLIASSLIACLELPLLVSCTTSQSGEKDIRKIAEINQTEIAKGDRTIALVGARLIDGLGNDPVNNATVIVDGAHIAYAGPSDDAPVPDDAERIDVSGLTLLPGLMDAHFHNEQSTTLAADFLARGITSVRDPGAWIEAFEGARRAGRPLPRLFLTGPHIDMAPPAYPDNSYIVHDPEEARLAVDKFYNQGASAIKVYFRLPVGVIQSICERADEYGIPVTGHLEITNARDAINVGLNGIEHVTSFGTCLVPARQAEEFRQKVLAENSARRQGRYQLWSTLNLNDNPAIDSLFAFLVDKGTYVCPTLATFERRSDRGDSTQVRGFANMLAFVGLAYKAGVTQVIGSHSWGPYGGEGYAYFREMELFQEAGMPPIDIIKAATILNARFFRVEDRLGSIEAGKLADLILVEGDPLSDIAHMRNVRRIMVNGVWIPVEGQER